MNQTQFIYQLKLELEKCQVVAIEDILSDYKEHFHQGLARGKSEEEISASLGQPAQIAKAYQADAIVKQVRENTGPFQWSKAIKTVGLVMVLAPFNFFFFFIPGVILFSFLLGGWGLGIGLCALVMTGLFWLPSVVFLASSFSVILGAFLILAGGLALAALVMISLFLISKFILMGVLSYFQWNLNFFLRKEAH